MGPELRSALAVYLSEFEMPDNGRPWDLAGIFPTAEGVVLEIGSGMGDATLACARSAPNTGLIAVEVHVKGIAATVRAAHAAGLTNLRVVAADAVEVLEDRVAPESLAGIRVWFPDPWPKHRHHKRRLVSGEFVSLAVSRLRRGGYLHLATDVESYAVTMAACLAGEPTLRAELIGGPRPADRPATRYEVAGIEAGREVWDFIYLRDGTE